MLSGAHFVSAGATHGRLLKKAQQALMLGDGYVKSLEENL